MSAKVCISVAALLAIGLAVAPAAAGTLSPEDQAYYRSLSPNGSLFGWCAAAAPVAGGYEYWIDFYTIGINEGWGYWIGGFDVAAVQNFADYPYVRDVWHYGYEGTGALVEMPESIHVPEDYEPDDCSIYRTATHDGIVVAGPPDGLVHTDRMWMYNWASATAGMEPGLLMTWRFVFSEPYYEGDLWVATSWWAEGLPVFNMPVPEPASISLLALGGLALLRRRRQ